MVPCSFATARKLCGCKMSDLFHNHLIQHSIINLILHHFVKYEFIIFACVCMHLCMLWKIISESFIYLKLLNRSTSCFETGRGPFRQIQIIYCFQNLSVHISIYRGLYNVYSIKFSQQHIISLDNLEITVPHFVAMWLLNGQTFLKPYWLRNGRVLFRNGPICQDGA